MRHCRYFRHFMRARPRGSKNPNAKGNGFKPGVSGNPNGRPLKGQSLAEHCRAVAGDGAKLAWLYACISGLIPIDATEKADRFGSSGLDFSMRIRQFMKDATTRDRLYCAGRLEDRAFGLIAQQHEHSGEVSLPTTVIHEYHSS